MKKNLIDNISQVMGYILPKLTAQPETYNKQLLSIHFTMPITLFIALLK